MITQYEFLPDPNLAWENTLPEKFSGVRLPGGSTVSATDEYYSLCFQEYPGNGYIIQYNYLSLLHPFILKTTMPHNGWHIHMLLKGRAAYYKADQLEWSLQKNQFSLSRTQGLDTLSLQEGEYISFNIFIEDTLLQTLLQMFPLVDKQITAFKNQDVHLIQNPLWINWETHEHIQSILHCRFESTLRTFFFDSRMEDILFNVLVQLSGTTVSENTLSESEMDAVHQAEQIITSDITKHFFIPALSKKVHLNEFRFKTAFKKIYGMGPYEYLVRLRMKKAREYLLAGYSVKEVAALTGYRPSDFTMAFIQHFGFTPSSLKKNN